MNGATGGSIEYGLHAMLCDSNLCDSAAAKLKHASGWLHDIFA